ncbi:RNA polymerase sigma factor [Propionicimonas sp.]|uniref:RNA polymerase sigma factor n=1 Tax=Propionicimonas sp. TaxID=1955623 RepID=UPI0039E24AD0
MGVLSDEQVWARVLAGDAALFGVIWDRHRDRVFRHLLGAGTGRNDAEDLTAVVFLELWRRRGTARFVDGSVLPWLLVTAVNVARNARRSRNRFRAFLARLPEPSPAPDAAQVLWGEFSGSRAERLGPALDGLGGRDRALLGLTAVEGFPVGQAAVALGMSEAAARMRLSRLRRRLRAEIGAEATMEGERG